MRYSVYRFSRYDPLNNTVVLKDYWQTGYRLVLDCKEITRSNNFKLDLRPAGEKVTTDGTATPTILTGI